MGFDAFSAMVAMVASDKREDEIGMRYQEERQGSRGLLREEDHYVCFLRQIDYELKKKKKKGVLHIRLGLGLHGSGKESPQG